MPGFISYRDYTCNDGEILRVVEFASAGGLGAWHNHPDHQKAQRGRDEFYAESDRRLRRGAQIRVRTSLKRKDLTSLIGRRERLLVRYLIDCARGYASPW